MLSLFHGRNKASSLAGWVCRRCYVTRVKGQRGIHPSNRGFARPLVFFVATPLTDDSRAVVKSMHGKVSIETIQSTFKDLKENNKLHWSIFSTYVPLLLSFKLVDEALQVMREAIMKSMIHPQFYNTFLELLFTRGHVDTAINFLKEVGYTPFPPTIEKWMKRLTYDGKPESIEKALDLAHFLAKETSLTLTDIKYTVVYEKIVGLHQAPQWCLSILHEFQNVGEPLPDTFTLPFLHIALVAKPSRDNVLHLVQLTSPKIFIDAITWYRDKGDLFLTPLIYKFIEKEFPELIPNFFRTLGYYSFARLWQLFAQILEPKIDPITKELRIEEDDSVLLSALAVIPQFGAGLLDRMVYKHVTVDAIYYEYKKVRDLPYLKNPFAQSTTSESSSPNGQVTKFPDAEEIFAEYSEAMERHGVRPTQKMNETVIVGFLRERREERAKEVMRWMQGEDLDISGIHTTFADYHVCHKTPESAAKVMLHDMAHDGVHPTLDDFNKINIMGEHGYLSHAAKLCRDMKGVCGIRPTLTVSSK